MGHGKTVAEDLKRQRNGTRKRALSKTAGHGGHLTQDVREGGGSKWA
jgi:hypothetical protein